MDGRSDLYAKAVTFGAAGVLGVRITVMYSIVWYHTVAYSTVLY